MDTKLRTYLVSDALNKIPVPYLVTGGINNMGMTFGPTSANSTPNFTQNCHMAIFSSYAIYFISPALERYHFHEPSLITYLQSEREVHLSIPSHQPQ